MQISQLHIPSIFIYCKSNRHWQWIWCKFVATDFFEKRKIEFGKAQMRTLHLIGDDDTHTNLAFLLSEQCTHMIKLAVFEGSKKGITLDDVKLGISVLHNQHLANIFYRLRLIEAYGTGILRINGCYDDYEVKPLIETTGNAFKITLPNTNKHVDLNTGGGPLEVEAPAIVSIITTPDGKPEITDPRRGLADTIEDAKKDSEKAIPDVVEPETVAPAPDDATESQSKSGGLFAGIALLLAALAVGGGYLYFRKRKEAES